MGQIDLEKKTPSLRKTRPVSSYASLRYYFIELLTEVGRTYQLQAQKNFILNLVNIFGP